MRIFYILFFFNVLLIQLAHCSPMKQKAGSGGSSPCSCPSPARNVASSSTSQPYTAQDHVEALRSARKGMEKEKKSWSKRTSRAGLSQSFCFCDGGAHWEHHTEKADKHKANIENHKNQLKQTLARQDFTPSQDPKVEKNVKHELHWAKKRLKQYPRDQEHRNEVRAGHVRQEKLTRGEIPITGKDDSDDELYG